MVTSSAAAVRIFSSAANQKKLEHHQRRKEKYKGPHFNFNKLPFDLKEMILRYLPAQEIGLCCAVSKEWGFLYQGAVASIYAMVVGVARGRSSLVRSAELKLLHRLRSTHEKAEAIETTLWATFNGYNGFVLRLIDDPKAMIDINSSGSEEWDSATILHVACRQGNQQLVKDLLQKGANPAALTRQNQTPLMLAAEYDKPRVVEILLEMCGRDLNVNQSDKTGRTALFTACEKGRTEIAVMLIDWGDMILQETGEAESILDIELGTLEMSSPLCIASRFGYSGIISRLLDSQVDVNATTEDGRSAIFLAAEWGKITCCKILLAKRPPVNEVKMVELLFNAQRHLGKPAALQLAQTETRVPNQLPHTVGVLIDLTSNAGKTPLFVAAERGNLDLTKLLIEASADSNKPTSLNKTPLYAATENGHLPVVKELLQYSSRDDVLRETNYGTTALFMAERNGNLTIKTLLSEFCLEKMDKERAKRKGKGEQKKQTQAMDRLFRKKKENSPSISKNQGVDETSSVTDGLGSKDIAKSKSQVEDSLAQLEDLEQEVSNIMDELKQGRVLSDIRNTNQEKSVENIVKPSDIQNMDLEKVIKTIANPSDIQNINQEKAIKTIANPSDIPNIDQEKSIKTIANPSVQRVAKEENTIGNHDDDEAPEMPECPSAASINSERSTTKTDVRNVRLQYFEKLLTKKEAPSRLVPKKEKELAAAKKFSDSFKDEECSLSLKTVGGALIEFSSLTSSHKFDDELLAKSFKESVDSVTPFYQLLKGKKTAANAWEVFVACTLFSTGTPHEKLGFCFGLFDTNSKGTIGISIVRTMLRCCCKSISKVKRLNNLSSNNDEIDALCQDLNSFEEYQQKDSISIKQFIDWSIKSPQGERIFKNII